MKLILFALIGLRALKRDILFLTERNIHFENIIEILALKNIDIKGLNRVDVVSIIKFSIQCRFPKTHLLSEADE